MNISYTIQQEIEEKIQHKKIKVVPKLASILNEDIMDNIFNEHRPDFIFHAAAYKHVKLVEDNPITSLENNVFGTLKVAKLSSKYSVRKLLFLLAVIKLLDLQILWELLKDYLN